MSKMLLARLLQGVFYMRSPDPREEKLHQRGLSSMSRLWSNYTQKREDVGNQKNEENMINQFPSLKGVNR